MWGSRFFSARHWTSRFWSATGASGVFTTEVTELRVFVRNTLVSAVSGTSLKVHKRNTEVFGVMEAK